MYIDKTRVADLEAVLAAAGRGEADAEAVVAAARRALASTNADDYDELMTRIGEMGEALTDEDGSNDREHDTAYAVFEAAQTLAPELAAREECPDAGTSCEWCGQAVAADAPYYDVDGRQCCEQCRAAADRHGAPYAVDRIGRETNFTDTVTLYERVDRDGDGEGCYLDADDAWRETEPGEKVAEAVYTLSDRVGLVRPGVRRKAEAETRDQNRGTGNREGRTHDDDRRPGTAARHRARVPRRDGHEAAHRGAACGPRPEDRPGPNRSGARRGDHRPRQGVRAARRKGSR